MTRNFDANTLNGDGLILWFDDLGSGNERFRFLSNFYEGEPITLPGYEWLGDYNTGANGFAKTFDANPEPGEYQHALKGKPVEFPTGEHAFAAMKVNRFVHPLDFYDIVHAPDPNAAKGLGRSVELRPDWEEVKYDAMAAVIRAKFTLDREEGRLLLETGDWLLAEGTFWHDSVWGVDLSKPGFPGRNWLGTLLMARRAELRAERFRHEVPLDRAAFFDRLIHDTKVSNLDFLDK